MLPARRPLGPLPPCTHTHRVPLPVADCDAFLTHDSPAVRKQHNSGYKHKSNVKSYYLLVRLLCLCTRRACLLVCSPARGPGHLGYGAAAASHSAAAWCAPPLQPSPHACFAFPAAAV